MKKMLIAVLLMGFLVEPVYAAMNEFTLGEVRKINVEASTITIKHREIKNLNMPPMTMVFQVKEAALLDTIKLGDQIQFKAVEEDGAILVTEIQLKKVTP